MFEKIVVPLDGSRLSAQALPYAAQLARQFNSEVFLVRIVSDIPTSYMSQVVGVMDAVGTDIITERAHMKDVENSAHAKRYLMNRAKELRDEGINVTYEVKEGPAARCIIEYALEQGASLIVMMSHGRGRFKRAMLGSVTDAIMRGGTMPVLVIRAKENTIS